MKHHGNSFKNTLTKVSKGHKKEKRNKLHIVDLGDNLSISPINTNKDVDDLLSTNDKSYMSKLDDFQSRTPVKTKTTYTPILITTTSKPLSNSHIPSKVDLTIKSITDETSKVTKVKLKYKSKGVNFNIENIQSNEDITNIIDCYQQLIINILDGSKPSYFYTLAKRYHSNSKSNLISNDELISIPKSIYFGYIGSKRSNLVTFEILKHPKLSKLIQRQEKANKVIQFWGVDPFVKYVLTPELLAHFIMDNRNLKDINHAYDLMEDTNDYGMYITDKITMIENPLNQQTPSETLNTEDSEDSFDPLELFDN